jgi:hypothetical protein
MVVAHKPPEPVTNTRGEAFADSDHIPNWDR